MIKEKLPIHKQYLVISAPISFRLVANNGTDFVERPAGVWQLDCYKLLPEKFMKNYPVFNLELEYDDSKIPDGFRFEYYFTNINLGDSLKGISGDLVELSDYQYERLLKTVKKQDGLLGGEIIYNNKISFDGSDNSDNLSFYLTKGNYVFYIDFYDWEAQTRKVRRVSRININDNNNYLYLFNPILMLNPTSGVENRYSFKFTQLNLLLKVVGYNFVGQDTGCNYIINDLDSEDFEPLESRAKAESASLYTLSNEDFYVQLVKVS